MSNSINFLLESDANYGLGIRGLTKNHIAFNELEKITEYQEQIMGYTVDKVDIHREDEYSPCLIEYSNNLEKYINDQKIISIEEAIDNVIEHYGIFEEDEIVIVVDESCIHKVDIAALSEKYKVARK